MTEEQVKKAVETLLKLYAEQNGINITIKDKEKDESTN